MCLLLGCVGQAQADLSAPEIADLLKLFLNTGDEAVRKKTLAKLVAVGPAGVARLESALADGTIYEAQPRGVLHQRFRLTFNNTDIEYVLCVPADYTPERSYPLLVALHGTGGTGKGFYRRWYRHLKNKDVLLAAPTSETPKRTQGYGATEVERQIPLGVIRDVRSRYRVDSDRVYLTGMSMGGHATWDNLLTYTDHYAAGIVECGIPMVEGFQIARKLFLPNLSGTGIYVMQGTPDKQAPEINRAAVDRLKQLGTDAVYVEFAGAGHGVYSVGSEDALKWLWSHKREPWPKKVTKVAHRLVQARAGWVRVVRMKGTEWDPRKRIKVRTPADTPKDRLRTMAEQKVSRELIHVTAEVQSGNRIVIRASRVSRLEVQLHPRLVDFSQKVRIIVNGRTAFFGRVQPTPKVLLDEAVRNFDFRRLPYASVEVPVR